MTAKNDDLLEIWINCPNKETASQIANALIKERLVACANIFAPIDSLYHWNGKVERDKEVPLLVKSRSSLFKALSDKVEALHPYDVAPIVAVPISETNASYRNWLLTETG